MQAAREAARRMQCTNHMKQLGLAIHNFHDAQRGLPPFGIELYRQSTFTFLTPYIEQAVLFEYMNNRTNGLMEMTSTPWWQNHHDWLLPHLDDTMRTAFSSVPLVKCPSRRSGVAQSPFVDNPEDSDPSSGPQGDYAVVCLDRYEGANIPGTDNTGAWFWGARQEWPALIAAQAGPIRAASIRGGEFSAENWNAWKPRDTFSRMADGTSNQFVLGEKHIPLGRLGLCSKTFEGNPNTDVLSGDCNIFTNGTWASAGFARSFDGWGVHDQMISKPSDHSSGPTSGYGPTHHYSFGSYHPGICTFALGDGSVQSVSVTTPHSILRAFSNVADGVAVSLP